MKRRFLTAALITLFIISLFVLSACVGKGTKINLNKYLSFNFTGTENYGEGSVSLDFDSLVRNNPKAFGLGSNPDDGEVESVKQILSDKISVTFEKTTNLSNGDDIYISWDADLDALKEIYSSTTLTANTQLVRVEGLRDAIIFNPFDGINVVFTGEQPAGTAAVQISEGTDSRLVYTLDRESGLRNGDKVVLSVGCADTSFAEYCREHSYTVDTTTREYTVSGLSGYILSLDEISEELINAVNERIETSFRADVEKNWTQFEKLNEIKFAGNFLLNAKEGSEADRHNILYFIYTINADTPKTRDSMDDPVNFTYYYYGRLNDIYIDENGDCTVYIDELTTPNLNDAMFYGASAYYYYTGYETYDDMYAAIVESNLANYDFAGNVAR